MGAHSDIKYRIEVWNLVHIVQHLFLNRLAGAAAANGR